MGSFWSKNMKFFVLKFFSILFLGLYCLNLQAYQYFSGDCKWPNNTIEFYYNPSNQPSTYTNSSGSFESLNVEMVEGWIQYAARQWSDNSGLIIRYMGLTDKSPFVNDDGYTVIGWADPESSAWEYRPKYTAAYVTYGTCNSEKKDMRMLLNTRRVNYGYMGQTFVKFWDGLITHEFGHVVGLDHNYYNNCDSVMAGGSQKQGLCGYKSTSYQRYLRADDIAGVQHKYPTNVKPNTCSDYIDVYETDTYCKSVFVAKNKGWMIGYNQDLFKGSFFGRNPSIIRAALLKVIMKSRFDGNIESDDTSCFDDFKSDDWYAPYACFAKEKGFIKGHSKNGVPTGKFKPVDYVTYAEALKISLKTYAQKENGQYFKELNHFDENNPTYGLKNIYEEMLSNNTVLEPHEQISDSDDGQWYSNYIYVAIKNKLPILKPNEAISRDFAAHLLCRVNETFGGNQKNSNSNNCSR